MGLYNKYRPHKLNDIVGQDHVVKTLENAVKLNRISHAYLFTGLRGTGKTSLARIMALIVNCENGPNCEYDIASKNCKSIINGSCPDLNEMDAATRTSIDDVREIRKDAYNVPFAVRKKIFIVDEIHCLRAAAASAFLSILEEPPKSAMFILCTTEPQKILPTIQSRCQRFDLRSIDSGKIAQHLSLICKKEKIEEVEQEGINLIAKAALGSMRDAISILESVLDRCNNKVSYKESLDIVGSTDQAFSGHIIEHILNLNHQMAIVQSFKGLKSGKDPKYIFSGLYEYISDLIFCKSIKSSKHLIVHESIKEIWKNQYKTTDMIELIYIAERLKEYIMNLQLLQRPDLSLTVCIAGIIEGLSKIKKQKTK